MKITPSTDPQHHTSQQAKVKRAAYVLPPSIPNAKWVPLAGGRFALVDEDDYERVSRYNWCSYSNGATRYAQCDHVSMHHFILRTTNETDHKNHNGLDNRKQNLRTCSHAQNVMNTRKTTGKLSRFKGVSFNKPINKWTSEITFQTNRSNLGYFENEEDAARAYDRAAIERFGEFAKLNFSQPTT